MTKELPNIEGTEAIAKSWRKLLERDRNISNLFSGTSFTTDQEEAGRPNWRTDLNRLFIYNGTDFINLFDYLTPEEISYSIDNPDVPSSVQDVKAILDLLVNRNNLNTVTMPAVGIHYVGNGKTFSYALDKYTSNKYSLYIFIDGVKQYADTYDLSDDGMNVTFKSAPAANENIEILQLASLAEWDYSPSVNVFTGDGTTKSFTTSFDILNVNSVSVNVSGKELQKSEFSVGTDGKSIILEEAPAENSKIQIITICKTSFVTVSPNSIGTAELKDGSVTASKLAKGIPVDADSIPTGSITSSKLANGSVTVAKLAEGSVTASAIASGTVTEIKLATAVKDKLLGVENIVTANIGNGVVTKDKLSAALVEEINHALAVSDGYTKKEADNLFLTKTDAGNTYLTKTDAGNTYLPASRLVVVSALPSNPDSNTFYFVKES